MTVVGKAERAGIYTEGCTESHIHILIITYIHMLIIYNYNLQCMELTTQGTS